MLTSKIALVPRWAITSYLVGSRTMHVMAALVLRQQLVESGTIASGAPISTVVLHDDKVLPEALNIMRSQGWETRLISPAVQVPESLYTRLAAHAQTRKVKDKAVWFQKLSIFTQLLDFDRVLYLDLDVFPLVSIKDVFQFNITGAPLWAVRERPGLKAPELQAGVLLFQPSQIDGNDMIRHLNDTHHKCGYRADDQSFLCHYFFKCWGELPRQLDVSHKYQREDFYGPRAGWRVIHFTGKKPFRELPAGTKDKWASRWHEVRQRCAECDELQKFEEKDSTSLLTRASTNSPSSTKSAPAFIMTPGNPDKTAVVFLVTHVDYLSQMKVSFRLLRENWLSKFPVKSVIIFHSSNIAAADIRDVTSGSHTDIVMVQISPSKPKYFEQMQRGGCMCCCNNRRGNQKGVRGGAYRVGYCEMNRFRTLEMYRHPVLANFDYFVQLDTDLYVRKPMPYNPVARMATSGAVFGFAERVVLPTAARDCNLGLYEAIDKWINKSLLLPVYVPPRGMSYAGNFNMGDLRFLRSEQYYAFARWINDEEMGIWSHRWGDQAFLPNIIGVYFPEEKHMWFRDLSEDKVLVHVSQSLGKRIHR